MARRVLSPRAFVKSANASSWEEIWEAGPYYERISELLEDAKEYAIFVGWQIDSRLRFQKPWRPSLSSWFSSQSINFDARYSTETLREKVLRLCEEKKAFEFYFLFWDHAYLYVFEREMMQGRIWDGIHPRIHFVFDNRHPFGASHHEKICIVDGRIVLCGGVDLCNDRWDTHQHLYVDPRRSLEGLKEGHGPYHDLAVQVTGPVCAVIQNHVAQRWRTLSSIPFPEASSSPSFAESKGHKVYVSRTMVPVDRTSRESSVIREVEFLFRDLIQAAEKRIILEGQYYWSQLLNDMLIAKIHQMGKREAGKNKQKDEKFQIFLILADLQTVDSLIYYMTSYELSLLQKLDQAARFADVSLTVGCPYVLPRELNDSFLSRPIYVHSKVLIIDDRFLAIGSANLATRALRIDTELHLTLEAQNKQERRHIERVGQKVLRHWNIESLAAEKAGVTSSSNLLNSHSGIEFRVLSPTLNLYHLRNDLRVAKLFPCQNFFDPPFPWFYRLKWKVYRFLPRRRLVIFFGLIGVWLIGNLFTLEISNLWQNTFQSIFQNTLVFQNILDDKLFYSALLSSVWFLPIPFIGVSILATLHFGLADAAKLSISAIWVSSLIGYTLTRVFPNYASRYYRRITPRWLEKRLIAKLNLRNFSSVLSVLVDPRINICSKISYQGLCNVPFSWFILGTEILLPAMIYGILSGVSMIHF